MPTRREFLAASLTIGAATVLRERWVSLARPAHGTPAVGGPAASAAACWTRWNRCGR